MIAIGKTLVSEDLLEKEFVCNLAKCKGACCVAGASGAPLLESELPIIEKIFDKIKHLLSPQGLKAIARKGLYVKVQEGEFETPLIGYQGACAYVTFDEHGVALCAIEKAYNEGLVDFKKPVSCHLYPVRITSYKEYDAVNYEKWKVCAPACKFGKQLGVPVFKFLKESLTRKYGSEWYAELEQAYNLKLPEQE
ncbi:MAG: DUF3109 family protein [Nitrosopumilus sp.]|nr:DUF3109 family protein [Nitrosopumilus sp.]